MPALLVQLRASPRSRQGRLFEGPPAHGNQDHFWSLKQTAAASTQPAPINGIPVTNVQTPALIRQSAIAKSTTRMLATIFAFDPYRRLGRLLASRPSAVPPISYRDYFLRIVGQALNLRLLTLLASNLGKGFAKISVNAFRISKRTV